VHQLSKGALVVRVVVAGRRNAEGKALEAELRGLGAEASFITRALPGYKQSNT
jgi:hypothetical protein